MNEVYEMPKKADESLKTKGGTYHSQMAAVNKYEEKNKDIEQVKVRLPKGSQDKLNEYVAKKAEEFPEDPRYSSFTGKYWRPSVNALIRSLIEEELGESLD